MEVMRRNFLFGGTEDQPTMIEPDNSMSFFSFCTYSKVEITIHKLAGLRTSTGPPMGWLGNNTNKAHVPTMATVAFSGSSPDIQVASSRVCSLTGHLLVDSESIRGNEAVWKTDEHHVAMQVQTPRMRSRMQSNDRELFGEKIDITRQMMEDDIGPKPVVDCPQTSFVESPHIPEPIQLVEHHRSSKLPEPARFSSHRTSSTMTDFTEMTKTDYSALPDVVEILIRLQTPASEGEEFLEWDGVVYIEVPMPGIHQYVLPVQTPGPPVVTTGTLCTSLDAMSQRNPVEALQQANLHIQVEVGLPDTFLPPRFSLSRPLSNTLSAKGPLHPAKKILESYSPDALEREMVAVLEQLRQSERQAWLDVKAHRQAMKLHGPKLNKDRSGKFWSVLDTLLDSCATVTGECFPHSTAREEVMNDASTIATRPSMFV